MIWVRSPNFPAIFKKYSSGAVSPFLKFGLIQRSADPFIPLVKFGPNRWSVDPFIPLEKLRPNQRSVDSRFPLYKLRPNRRSVDPFILFKIPTKSAVRGSHRPFVDPFFKNLDQIDGPWIPSPPL